jgi:hypothetical protein
MSSTRAPSESALSLAATTADTDSKRSDGSDASMSDAEDDEERPDLAYTIESIQYFDGRKEMEALLKLERALVSVQTTCELCYRLAWACFGD